MDRYTPETPDQVREQLQQFIREAMEFELPGAFAPPIQKLPDDLAQGKEKNPKLPSTLFMGPFHAHDESAISYKEAKMMSVKIVIGALNANSTRMPTELIEELMKSEVSARAYYKGQIISDLKSSEFLKIMILDGCYLGIVFLSGQKKDGGVMAKGGGSEFNNLLLNIVKLECQIPFFVLESIYEKFRQSVNPETFYMQYSLADSALSFLGRTILKGHILDRPKPDQSIDHVLHLVNIALFPPPPPPSASTTIPLMSSPSPLLPFPSNTRCASELKACGVVFKKRDNTFLADIEFRNGVLEIPQLDYNEVTASLFNSLLEHELLSGEIKGRLLSYMIFMGSLVSDEKDVEVLIRSEVLQTRIKDVSGIVSFFDSVSGIEAFLPANHFSHLVEQLNAYCESGLHPLRARLVNYYYHGRWDVFNSFLLFFLTFSQTLFSILAYFPPKK